MPNETCKKFAETLIAEFHSIFGVTPEVEHNSEYSTVTLDIWNCDPNVVNKRSIEKLVCRITQRLNLDPDLTTYDLTRGHMMVQYRQDAFWITSKETRLRLGESFSQRSSWIKLTTNPLP